ncbi:MAG TPA: HDIG domain-containing protein [Candidatus Baltobacteraceae bacterium]|nr:HDIG domain-containing protein [Candidatus Baltobacteraceae bacterium]
MYEVLPADRAIADVVPPGALFAVGGRVRDELRRDFEGAAVALKDLDYIVTGVAADDLERRLRRVGRVDLVGASFAVFKVTFDGRTVDVALPRRERSTGAGHRDFAVESGPEIPLEDDLARRDFRMNMIARALPSGELVDPYGGAQDIRARRVDILTHRTFEEDPLRMLRAAQFAARFGYTLTEKTRAAMRAAAPLVRSVSAERIADEFTKLLVQAPKPSMGFELLRDTGVLPHVWPELLEGVGVEQNEWHAYEVYRHNLETLDSVPAGDLVLRLAALLHDVGKPRTKEGPHFYRHEQVGADLAREMLGRLRFSNEVVQTAEHLVRQHMYVADPELSDAAIRRFIRRIGVAHLDRQFALRAADIAGSGLPKRDDSNERFQTRVYAEVARKPAFSVTDLRIDGAAVIEAMVAGGLAQRNFRGDKRVGDALQYLFEQVTEQPERNEPATLRALLDQYLTQQRREFS